MNEHEELWENLSSSLYFYFLWGGEDLYLKFNERFIKNFDVDNTDNESKYEKLKPFEENGEINPIAYIHSVWASHRSDCEREIRAIKIACQFVFKLKNENKFYK